MDNIAVIRTSSTTALQSELPIPELKVILPILIEVIKELTSNAQTKTKLPNTYIDQYGTHYGLTSTYNRSGEVVCGYLSEYNEWMIRTEGHNRPKQARKDLYKQMMFFGRVD